MTFAAPLWLAVLGFLPLIVWLHMRRRPSHEVPTTFLWRSIAEERPPRSRLRRPPLSVALLLQVAALIAFAVVLAEPRSRTSLPTPTLLLVDVGIGMGLDDDGGPRLAAAVRSLTAATSSGVGPWDLWTVADGARPVAVDVRALDVLHELLEGLVATDVATSWPRAVADLEGRSVAADRIVVATNDAVAARAALSAASSFDADLPVEVHDYAAPFGNVAVVVENVVQDSALVRRWTVEGEDRVVGDVARPTHAVIGFAPDDGAFELELAKVALTFTPTGIARYEGVVDAPQSGILHVGTVEGRDLASADDRVVVRIDPEPQIARVAVLGPEAAASSVRRALLALGASVVGPDDPDLDLAVVAGGPDPFAAAGDRPRAVLWLGTAEGVDGVSDLPRRSAAASRWRGDHPLAASIPWGRLEDTPAVDLPWSPDAAIVVDGLAGALVGERTRAGVRDVWVALDPTDPAWTEDASFLALLADALSWLAPSRGAVTACHVGVPCPVPPDVALNGGSVRMHGSVVAQWSGVLGSVPAEASSAWVPLRAGIATWTEGESSGTIAVQLRAEEHEALAAAASASRAVAPPARSRIRFHWAVIAILSVVLAEALLAGLGGERFLRIRTWAHGRVGRNRALSSTLLIAVGGILVAAWLQAPWPVQRDLRYLVVVGEAIPRAWPEERVRHVPPIDVDGYVDVREGLELALAAARGSGADRIVWVDPRAPTRGTWVELAVAAHGTSPRIDFLSSASALPPDVAVLRVDADRTPTAGHIVNLRTVVWASESLSARVRLMRDGSAIADVTTQLQAGANMVQTPVATSVAGTEFWRAEVAAPGDTEPRNDVAEAMVEVLAPPRVWVVSSETDRAVRFVEALRTQGIDAVQQAPFQLPTLASGFRAIDAVVLANVAALEVTTQQQEALETWVRDSGGALLIAGGERAFGPGGYVETPLDRVSPLSSMVPREAPEVAMLFVLDRSGSMQQAVGATTRLEIAKEATLTAVGLLGEASQVAVVVFDEQAHVLLPWTSSSERAAIEGALAALVPGGGTGLYTGLVAARDLLEMVESATRHVVLMTDGLSQPGDFLTVTHEIRATESTVSAVAIGQGADVSRIREIALAGGGAAHVTADFRALPGILAQEALLLSGDPVIHELVVPLTTSTTTSLTDGMPKVWPPVTAFVETTPKSDAEVILGDDRDRPILASWRYGAGRVLAFTSQVVGPWVEAWTAVEGFPGWWGQWLRWAIQHTPENTVLDVRGVGDAVYVVVEARQDGGAPRSGLRLEAEWMPSSGRSTDVRLRETDPGRYVGTLEVAPGLGEITVASADGTITEIGRSWIHPYPARLGYELPFDREAVASAFGGLVLEDTDALRMGADTWRWRLQRAWRSWLALALTIWLAWLAMRYGVGRLPSPRPPPPNRARTR